MSCLKSLFRLNTIRSGLHVTKLFYSTQNVNGINLNKSSVIFSNLINNSWIYQQQTIIENPLSKIPSVIELPKSIYNVPTKSDPEPLIKSDIFDPLPEVNKIKKEAVKLIVIRRHKMRKHKLKKLRKKMKFEWAKIRQRREMKKEKLFQGELLAQIKEAEKFSAEEFVAEKIRKATEIQIPKLWKGKRLPEPLIREKMGLPPK